MEGIIEIVKYLEDSGLLTKVQNEVKELNGGFISMLLDTLGARLLGNISARKGINRARYGSKDLQSNKGKVINREGFGSQLDF